MNRREATAMKLYREERARRKEYLKFATRVLVGEKFRILCVDDEPRILKFLFAKLRSEGYEVLTANNGQEGLSQVAAASGDLDLIILDIVMPIMDGWKMFKQLRTFSAVPVIILSARGSDAEKITGLNMGADDYVAKPFNPDELVARIGAVLRRTALAHPAYELLGEAQKDFWRQKADTLAINGAKDHS